MIRQWQPQLICTLLLLAAAVTAMAQTATVTDPTGAVVPGVGAAISHGEAELPESSEFRLAQSGARQAGLWARQWPHQWQSGAHHSIRFALPVLMAWGKLASCPVPQRDKMPACLTFQRNPHETL